MLESLKKLEDAQAVIKEEKEQLETKLLEYEQKTKELIQEKSIAYSNHLETYEIELEKDKKSIYDLGVEELSERTREQLESMERMAESETGNLATVILEEVKEEYGSF